jgi:ribosomal subunit interface protein
MRKTIKATHFELTPAISDYLEKKIISPIEKLMGKDDSAIVDIEVGRTTAHHKHGDVFRTEVSVHGKKMSLRAEKSHVDLYGSVELVRDEIIREIENSIKKNRSIVRRGSAKIKSLFRKSAVEK